MNRNVFLKKLGGALVALPIISLIGCSSDDDVTPTPPAVSTGNCNNGATGAIGTNHGHSLAVSAADVQAGVQKTYTIQGTSGHDHNITLSVANFTTLSTGTSVSVNSTAGGGHTHSVNVVCA